MIKRGILFFLSLITIVTVTGCYYDNEEELYKYVQTPCDTNSYAYAKNVAPILSKYCYSCHGQSSPTSGIAIEGYSNLLPYVTNNSLWGTINHLNGYSPMPQNGNKLSDCNLTIIKKWIAAGALNN